MEFTLIGSSRSVIVVLFGYAQELRAHVTVAVRVMPINMQCNAQMGDRLDLFYEVCNIFIHKVL